MENECLICLENLDNNIVVLSCPHKKHYHYNCLLAWIIKAKCFTKPCLLCNNNVEIINILNPLNDLKQQYESISVSEPESESESLETIDLEFEPVTRNSLFSCCTFL